MLALGLRQPAGTAQPAAQTQGPCKAVTAARQHRVTAAAGQTIPTSRPKLALTSQQTQRCPPTPCQHCSWSRCAGRWRLLCSWYTGARTRTAAPRPKLAHTQAAWAPAGIGSMKQGSDASEHPVQEQAQTVSLLSCSQQLDTGRLHDPERRPHAPITHRPYTYLVQHALFHIRVNHTSMTHAQALTCPQTGMPKTAALTVTCTGCDDPLLTWSLTLGGNGVGPGSGSWRSPLSSQQSGQNWPMLPL